jgi:DNA-binding transcriptional LysR family regulator
LWFPLRVSGRPECPGSLWLGLELLEHRRVVGGCPFFEEHPALEVKIREGGTEAQLRRLRAGRIDIGVIAAGAGLEYGLGDLELDRLTRGQAYLIVCAEHRFAGRGWVNVADLEHERWIVGEADRSGPQFGAWPTLASDPDIVYTLRDWTGRFGLVAAGLGVAVIPSQLLPALPPRVRALRGRGSATIPPRGSRGHPPRPHPQPQTVIAAMRDETGTAQRATALPGED